MGYYSKIGLILTKSANENLIEAIKTESEYVQELIQNWPDHHKVNEETGDVLYARHSIKWYGDECEFVDKFLKTLDSKDYHFMRLGEEYGDKEECGDHYDGSFNLIPSSVLEIM
jgi:hypothetical protein